MIKKRSVLPPSHSGNTVLEARPAAVSRIAPQAPLLGIVESSMWAAEITASAQSKIARLRGEG